MISRMTSSLGVQATPVSLGGATSSVWAIGDYVLRVGPRTRITSELDAAQAASSVISVPTIVDRVDIDDQSGVLMKRVPGAPAGDLSNCSALEANRRGRRCGLLHQALSTVRAPNSVPVVSGLADPGPEPRLLHLDLHPWNVLVDPAGEIFTVIDWANASVGPPEIDLARTATILTLDPATQRLNADSRWQALVDGWREGSGWDALPERAWVWAMRFMLNDLSTRYSEADLQPIRAALANLR
jgi:hypothetical protein